MVHPLYRGIRLPSPKNSKKGVVTFVGTRSVNRRERDTARQGVHEVILHCGSYICLTPET